MDLIIKIIASFAVAVFLSFTHQVSAFTVWAVDGGADPATNQSGNVLYVAPGSQTIDLYFDTESDISWGWDITLELAGTGLISGLNGGDINGGFGTPTANGYHQLGGNAASDVSGGPFLLFSFFYDSAAGAVTSLVNGSSYTSGTTFSSAAIGSVNLVQTVVPLPGSVWFMLSALLALAGLKRNVK